MIAYTGTHALHTFGRLTVVETEKPLPGAQLYKHALRYIEGAPRLITGDQPVRDSLTNSHDARKLTQSTIARNPGCKYTMVPPSTYRTGRGYGMDQRRISRQRWRKLTRIVAVDPPCPPETSCRNSFELSNQSWTPGLSAAGWRDTIWNGCTVFWKIAAQALFHKAK